MIVEIVVDVQVSRIAANSLELLAVSLFYSVYAHGILGSCDIWNHKVCLVNYCIGEVKEIPYISWMLSNVKVKIVE